SPVRRRAGPSRPLKPLRPALNQRLRMPPAGCAKRTLPGPSGQVSPLAPTPGREHNVASEGGLVMRHVDFAPLYRSTVGFDRLFDMLDSVAGFDAGASAYP